VCSLDGNLTPKRIVAIYGVFYLRKNKFWEY